MNYRTLGKTNLKVSEVGFGTWQLANDPNCWVGADLDESLRSLHRFVELGGNFIDTAWVYGYSEEYPNRHPSEELVSKLLKESKKKDQIIVATKVPPKNWKWPAWRDVSISEVFPNDHIEKCVDDSLRSLGVETLDLVQFHVWQDSFVDEDGWKYTIQKLSKVGKVKYWGISINDYQPSNCLKTLDTGLISTIQFIFNVFHQKPTEKLFPYAKEKNIGLIARVPLDEGGLSGNFEASTVFEKGDFRQNYFTKEETIEILTNAKKHGMTPKVHAEQLSNFGGVLAGVEVGAISVDHLEFISDKDIEALKNSKTMPTILPGAAFFLNLPLPPARKMIDAGLPVAIASDYNPGSCPSGNMNFMMSICCIQYKMTPEEAINAATINSAYAMDLSKTHGSIAIGKLANVFITKEIPGYGFIPYSFGSNLIETVIINGEVIETKKVK